MGHDEAARSQPVRQLHGGPASLAVELHADLPDARQDALGGRQDVPLGAFAIELQEIESVDGVVLHQAFERNHLDDFRRILAFADSRSHARSRDPCHPAGRTYRSPHCLHVREPIERNLRFDHLDVCADWLDGQDSASRAPSCDLHGKGANVRPDVDDRRIFRQNDIWRAQIRVQNRRFVHRRQIGGAGSNQILRAVAQLESNTSPELGQRHGPPVPVGERKRDCVGDRCSSTARATPTPAKEGGSHCAAVLRGQHELHIMMREDSNRSKVGMQMEMRGTFMGSSGAPGPFSEP